MSGDGNSATSASSTDSSALERDAALFERVMDALRAGPGTLEWDEALRQVEGGKENGVPADVRAQVELLTRVRRRLSAGRRWREVSAGDRFTRKLMARIDAGPERKTLPITGWVVVLGLLAVAGAGVYLASELMKSGGVETRGPVGMVGSPVVVWDFCKAWPARTRLEGGLPTVSDAGGWRPQVGPGAGTGSTSATALLDVPLEPQGQVAIEVTLELSAASSAAQKPKGDSPDAAVVAQIFVTSSPETLSASRPAQPAGPQQATGDQRTASDLATGSEWVCQIDPADRLAIVSPTPAASSGRSSSALVRLPSGTLAGGREVTLRLLLAGESASIEAGGAVVWSGPLGLAGEGGSSASSARYVGVRLVSKPGSAGSGPALVPIVKQLRVLGRN